MIRVALVGVGRWGRTLLRAFAERTEVAYCVNRSDPSLAAWLAEKHPDSVATTDLERVLADARVDAVAIATPIASHAALSRRALDAGKHLFVEKPLASRAREAAELVGLARSRGRTLFVGHTYVYDPAFAHLRMLVGGPPRSAAFHWTKFGTFGEDLLTNLLSHDVALARCLFQASPVGAEVLASQSVRTDADIATYRLQFTSGDCLIDIDRCAPSTRKTVTAVTPDGRLFAWEGDQVFAEGADGLEPVYRRTAEPLGVEIDAFLESVSTGRPAVTDGAFGVEVLDTIERLAPAMVRR